MNRAARRQIGAALADGMDKYCALATAGKKLGLDRAYVQRIERDALYKVYVRMKAKL